MPAPADVLIELERVKKVFAASDVARLSPAFYNTGTVDVSGGTLTLQGGDGAAIVGSPNRIAAPHVPERPLTPDDVFESRLRMLERREVPALLPNARAWYASRVAARRH